MSREAMQMALNTLEGWANYGKWVWPESALEQAKRNTTESIAALRQALETDLARVGEVGVWGEWVGLTNEEVSDVIDNVLEGGGWLDVARALEAAIKRKNT